MSIGRKQTSVSTDIVVQTSIEHAFDVFVGHFDQIKPREHNLLEVDIAESVLEPHAGGRVFDRGIDGSECSWGRVLDYDPPQRIVFTWDIGPQWQIETDEGRCSEVEVRFTAEGLDKTRVEITHSHLERHGEGWEGLVESLGTDQGWPLYLQRFAAQVTPPD